MSTLDQRRARFEDAWRQIRGDLGREVGRAPRSGRWAAILVAGAVGLALAIGLGRRARLPGKGRGKG